MRKPCTCLSDGNARRCPHHTQADFDFAERQRAAPTVRDYDVGRPVWNLALHCIGMVHTKTYSFSGEWTITIKWEDGSKTPYCQDELVELWPITMPASRSREDVERWLASDGPGTP